MDREGSEDVLARLLDGQRQALSDDLVGSYLFGSAATGSYEPGIRDLDTVAVLRSDLTDEQLTSLDRLLGGRHRFGRSTRNLSGAGDLAR